MYRILNLQAVLRCLALKGFPTSMRRPKFAQLFDSRKTFPSDEEFVQGKHLHCWFFFSPTKKKWKKKRKVKMRSSKNIFYSNSNTIRNRHPVESKHVGCASAPPVLANWPVTTTSTARMTTNPPHREWEIRTRAAEHFLMTQFRYCKIIR